MSKFIPEIADFCRIESPEAKCRFEQIKQIMLGEFFLAGLGSRSDLVAPSDGLNVTGSIIEAVKLSGDQEMMKTPEPWSHQTFIEQLPSSPVPKVISDGIYGFVDALEEYVAYLSQKNQILNTNLDLVEQLGVSEEAIQHVVDNILIDYLPLILNEWLLSAFYEDEKILAFWDFISVCFAAGGLPCGWLGPRKFIDGGVPSECMVMFHRCYGSRPREILFTDLREAWP